MPQITDIKPQKSSKGGEQRFNIYVDGKFAFALPAIALAKAGLKIDQEISLERIEKLAKENEFLKVFDRALNFFSYRPRSEKEFQDWFTRKQVGQETQKLVVEKLQSLGYLNDEEFAKWWIEQRSTFRPAGERLLRMELLKKGLSKDLIAQLLKDSVSKDSEIEMAKRIVQKKLKSIKNLPDLELKQKLYGFLSRRGFDWGIIEKVVDEIIKKD